MSEPRSPAHAAPMPLPAKGLPALPPLHGTAAPAADRFESYYLEKLWAMLPELLRADDALEESGGTLRAFLSAVAREAAELRRETDRLWEDQHLDGCEDALVPLLGALVQNRPVPSDDARARRVDVARTVHYRRRRGTPALLETLAAELGRMDVVLVEAFRRLARTPHHLDPHPATRVGRFSQSPLGGTLRLTSPLACSLIGTAFDETSRTPDFRRLSEQAGRYAIARLNFHLFPYATLPVSGVTPKKFVESIEVEKLVEGVPTSVTEELVTYSLDPSGRPIALFQAGTLAGDGRVRLPSDVRAPLAARLLDHSLRQRLLVEGTTGFDEDATETNLYPVCVDLGLATEEVGAARLLPNCRRDKPADRNDVTWWLDPEQGIVQPIDPEATLDSTKVSYLTALSAALGATTLPRSGAPTVATVTTTAVSTLQPQNHVYGDNQTYNLHGSLALGKETVIASTDGKRPYVRLTRTVPTVPFTLAPAASGAKLRVEGVWLGGADTTNDMLLVLAKATTPTAGAWDWDEVVLDRVTLDPGGDDLTGTSICRLWLTITGRVRRLVIDRSIVGCIEVAAGGHLESLVVRQSVLGGLHTNRTAIDAPRTEARFDAVTVLGTVELERLFATDCLIEGTLTVRDHQAGCLRYSAVRGGERLPPLYRAVTPGTALPSELPQPEHFVSLTYGDYGYARLTEQAPLRLRTGGSDGGELGAFASLRTPPRLQSIQAKLDEYAPVETEPRLIVEAGRRGRVREAN